MIKLFFSHNANIEAQDDDGITPLLAAVYRNHHPLCACVLPSMIFRISLSGKREKGEHETANAVSQPTKQSVSNPKRETS